MKFKIANCSSNVFHSLCVNAFSRYQKNIYYCIYVHLTCSLLSKAGIILPWAAHKQNVHYMFLLYLYELVVKKYVATWETVSHLANHSVKKTQKKWANGMSMCVSLQKSIILAYLCYTWNWKQNATINVTSISPVISLKLNSHFQETCSEISYKSISFYKMIRKPMDP